jgi:bacterioferritin B
MNERDAQKTKFHALLQEQVFNEFTSAQQYIAIAVYFDDADLPQLAKHFYRQALEERNHAMMLVQYLLDRDVHVEVPGADAVRNQFDTPKDALALALDQERAVTEQVTRLTSVARDEGDYLGEQFMQWFLKEQIEEVALMTTLLRVAERAGTNLFELENFVGREINTPRAATCRSDVGFTALERGLGPIRARIGAGPAVF